LYLKQAFIFNKFIGIHFLSHRKHISSSLARRTCWCCFRT